VARLAMVGLELSSGQYDRAVALQSLARAAGYCTGPGFAEHQT